MGVALSVVVGDGRGGKTMAGDFTGGVRDVDPFRLGGGLVRVTSRDVGGVTRAVLGTKHKGPG